MAHWKYDGIASGPGISSQTFGTLSAHVQAPVRVNNPMSAIEGLLLTAARVSTFDGQLLLTNASGFFFERDGRLFLVTSRHVMIDEPSGTIPIGSRSSFTPMQTTLPRRPVSRCRCITTARACGDRALDSAGDIDVALIELERAALPATMAYRAFTPEHLEVAAPPPVGTPLLIVCFPLGFHDTLHHLPVVRHAVIASSYGLRFQGKGYFLTDARTHRGTSGAPVLLSRTAPPEGSDLAWTLLGVHSARIDVGTRDLILDRGARAELRVVCGHFA